MEAPQRKETNYDDDNNDSCSCGSNDCQSCKCKQQHGDGQVKLTTVHEQKKKRKWQKCRVLIFKKG